MQGVGVLSVERAKHPVVRIDYAEEKNFQAIVLGSSSLVNERHERS
jgi:hypothetical protein